MLAAAAIEHADRIQCDQIVTATNNVDLYDDDFKCAVIQFDKNRVRFGLCNAQMEQQRKDERMKEEEETGEGQQPQQQLKRWNKRNYYRSSQPIGPKKKT